MAASLIRAAYQASSKLKCQSDQALFHAPSLSQALHVLASSGSAGRTSSSRLAMSLPDHYAIGGILGGFRKSLPLESFCSKALAEASNANQMQIICRSISCLTVLPFQIWYVILGDEAAEEASFMLEQDSKMQARCIDALSSRNHQPAIFPAAGVVRSTETLPASGESSLWVTDLTFCQELLPMKMRCKAWGETSL